jgi:hypothetical protein
MSPYPLRFTGRLDEPLSRWLWLVKWLLAIPHFIVLFFLWIAFALLWIVALFAILFTGRYPRGIFDFNVGVMRWTWRVSFYTYSALGTDRYPPFSFEGGDYPADLAIDYPVSLSRGKVLIKWWLLALPQYLIVAVFAGAGYGIGLIGIVVFIGAVALLFTGAFPRSLFDLAMGANRWCYRVLAYVALMTDTYPPFRLDQGPEEPTHEAPIPGAPVPA